MTGRSCFADAGFSGCRTAVGKGSDPGRGSVACSAAGGVTDGSAPCCLASFASRRSCFSRSSCSRLFCRSMRSCSFENSFRSRSSAFDGWLHKTVTQPTVWVTWVSVGAWRMTPPETFSRSSNDRSLASSGVGGAFLGVLFFDLAFVGL